MPRILKEECLRGFARDLVSMWFGPNVQRPGGNDWIWGPNRVMQDLHNLTYKDEYDFLLNDDSGGFKSRLGAGELVEFEREVNGRFPERKESTLADLLKQNLAIDLNGNHIDGCIGTVQVGVRPIRRRLFEVETRDSIRRRKRLGLPIHVPGRTDRETEMRMGTERWPVFAGEPEERMAGREPYPLPEDAMATLPDGRLPHGLNANVPNFSAEAIVAALDGIVDRLDEGSTAATIRGRTGTQPADPDAAETGTLLFTLTMAATAFGAAADDTDGTCSASAAAITDDTSADATDTLTYCRAGATGTGADDHIDGSAGTASVDFVFNTVSIVTGSTVSMSSFVVGMSQGSTAT